MMSHERIEIKKLLSGLDLVHNDVEVTATDLQERYNKLSKVKKNSIEGRTLEDEAVYISNAADSLYEAIENLKEALDAINN